MSIFEIIYCPGIGLKLFIRAPVNRQWLWVNAPALLIHNWIAGAANLFFFALFYPARLRAEERSMLDAIGEPCRVYMRSTGAALPKKRGCGTWSLAALISMNRHASLALDI